MPLLWPPETRKAPIGTSAAGKAQHGGMAAPAFTPKPCGRTCRTRLHVAHSNSEACAPGGNVGCRRNWCLPNGEPKGVEVPKYSVSGKWHKDPRCAPVLRCCRRWSLAHERCAGSVQLAISTPLQDSTHLPWEKICLPLKCAAIVLHHSSMLPACTLVLGTKSA